MRRPFSVGNEKTSAACAACASIFVHTRLLPRRPKSPLISLFVLPLQRVTLDARERDALASFHLCSCTQWTAGSIFCYTEGDLLVSVVGNLDAKRLEKHVTGP